MITPFHDGLFSRRPQRLRPGKRWDVLVLDTMGELARFYALCDAAFVGGSLVPWGGHNILEPAFYGKPVFFGPHMHNFAFLAETFVREGGGRIVQDQEDLTAFFLFKNERVLKAMGRRATQTLVSLQGATSGTIQAIEQFIAKETNPASG